MRGPPQELILTDDDIAEFQNLIVEGAPDECWSYSGPKMQGYGVFRASNGVRYQARKIIYAIAHGDLPPKKFVRSSCNNRGCCNAAHLYAGDTASNGRLRDARRHHDAVLAAAKVLPRKLTENEVRSIRVRVAGGVLQAELAKEYGVTRYCIEQVVSRRTWKDLP